MQTHPMDSVSQQPQQPTNMATEDSMSQHSPDCFHLFLIAHTI